MKLLKKVKLKSGSKKMWEVSSRASSSQRLEGSAAATSLWTNHHKYILKPILTEASPTKVRRWSLSSKQIKANSKPWARVMWPPRWLLQTFKQWCFNLESIRATWRSCISSRSLKRNASCHSLYSQMEMRSISLTSQWPSSSETIRLSFNHARNCNTNTSMIFHRRSSFREPILSKRFLIFWKAAQVRKLRLNNLMNMILHSLLNHAC